MKIKYKRVLIAILAFAVGISSIVLIRRIPNKKYSELAARIRNSMFGDLVDKLIVTERAAYVLGSYVEQPTLSLDVRLNDNTITEDAALSLGEDLTKIFDSLYPGFIYDALGGPSSVRIYILMQKRQYWSFLREPAPDGSFVWQEPIRGERYSTLNDIFPYNLIRFLAGGSNSNRETKVYTYRLA
jgi:hypothetical protein